MTLTVKTGQLIGLSFPQKLNEPGNNFCDFGEKPVMCIPSRENNLSD